MTGPLWTSADIAQATGGAASAPFAVSGVAFDSREVTDGDLFVAMKGEATDGHKFLDKAFAQGAAGAIVSEPVDHPHILVPDSAAALEALPAFEHDALESACRALAESMGLKPAEIIHPARMAVSGKTKGAGLFELMELLGRETVIRRMRGAAS